MKDEIKITEIIIGSIKDDGKTYFVSVPGLTPQVRRIIMDEIKRKQFLKKSNIIFLDKKIEGIKTKK